MATENNLTKNVTTKEVNHGAEVRKSWRDEWHKPEPAYEFSNGRKFQTPKNPYQSADE
jgi:hypothetical protein